jgi:hypothetical protein
MFLPRELFSWKWKKIFATFNDQSTHLSDPISVIFFDSYKKTQAVIKVTIALPLFIPSIK